MRVRGTVQGVGFRPHVYRKAVALGLKGWVINTSGGVRIHVEGEAEAVRRFVSELPSDLPPLACIEEMELLPREPVGYETFFIHESLPADDVAVTVPPDVGLCPDCLREYRDPEDRRYGYEFINCVNCGPRFSIIRAVPYDRENTSMAVFTMCKECRQEYEDPANRRFHAEPNACPRCGPQLRLVDREGKEVVGDPRHYLRRGKILAVKGIGGYHLACDALNWQAVRELRERKRRETKPFALMARDLDTVRKYCHLSPEEERLLTAPERPILLLRSRGNPALSPEVAPGLNSLGVMLPYTAIHFSLFDESLELLVMTSANLSGDPLILTEEEAFQDLRDIADLFLIHNREIVNRVDDSVVTLFQGKEYFIRRARGYVPLGLKVSRSLPPLFAAGGDLKNVFAFSKGRWIVPSQHFGDLENPRNLDAYRRGVEFFRHFLQVEPVAAVADLHPLYFSTAFAEEMGLPVVKVQHHRAHFASCLADNEIEEKVLGVVCDGTGYGEDGTVWGCEFFYGEYCENERVGSLLPYWQPVGDSVQKNLAQMGAMLLLQLGWEERDILSLFPELAGEVSIIKAQIRSEKLSIPSSSSGRLFDAAAAIAGICGRATYEGEGPMRLEAAAERASGQESYPVRVEKDDMYRLSWHFVEEVARDRLAGVDPAVIARRFHLTFAQGIEKMLLYLRQEYPARKVVFSGGVFQNRLLAGYLAERLLELGLTPCFHRRVPPSDGGLAVGQIMIAAGRVEQCV